MDFKRTNTLFFKTATTLVLTMLLLTALIWGATAWFLLIPVGKQSADDLAALLILSAQTWVELPPETRPEFRHELLTGHQIKLQSPTFHLVQSETIHPYLSQLLYQSLQDRVGSITSIGESEEEDSTGWLWVDIPINDEIIRFGFSSGRIGASPPAVIISATAAVLLLTIITALILAQRLSHPLAKLSDATTTIGKGRRHKAISVDGPDEIETLADNFNQMAHEIHELLENRTTLLAGISHDLRTPLTRLRLAVELLHGTGDKSIRHDMEADIDDMERLLQQALELARGIEKKEPQENIDLSQLISQLVAPYQAANENIGWNPVFPAYREITPQTFGRVFTNLVENAIRYGENRPVNIKLDDSDGIITISICDHGAGIPESEREAIFRPFYRLEQSRSVTTGGSGLGLAIVQQLCNAQGWKIAFHTGEEGGTEARLIIS
ncbi:MAG: HAMP domain-containing protein [Gammaproteobacteria bacterium]|nr:HAMP domain-containing protein [Gammaproteobacteria bacterium]